MFDIPRLEEDTRKWLRIVSYAKWPTLDLSTGHGSRKGRLCYVCCRGWDRNEPPWAAYACCRCWLIDRTVGRRLGGKRFFPLGIHSVINGVGIPLTLKDHTGLRAAADQVVAHMASQQEVFQWREQEIARLTTLEGIQIGVVDMLWWGEMFPATPLASAYAYLRLLQHTHPWVLDLEPTLADVDYLLWSIEADLIKHGYPR